MEYRGRKRGRMMAENLQPRQTTAQAQNASPIPQPTSVVALPATFTPPASCSENLLTMMPPPGYMIWANEPVPFPGQTVGGCYPPEFLRDYKSVSSASVGSSIVPAMSPLACPQNYCTMMADAKNYIACCPSGYQFHPPETAIDPDRPAYGGTCYSDLAPKTDYPVIAYNSEGKISSQVFSASASGAQAYAHPIDGWALSSPSIIGCPTSSPSPSPTPSPSSSTPKSASPETQNSPSHPSEDPMFNNVSEHAKTMSPGAVAGAAIGGVLGLLILLALVWLGLSYRRKHSPKPPPPPPKIHHMADDYGDGKQPDLYRYEVEGGKNGLVNNGHGAYEMPAVAPVELHDGGAAKLRDLRVLSGMLDRIELARVTRMANWKSL